MQGEGMVKLLDEKSPETGETVGGSSCLSEPSILLKPFSGQSFCFCAFVLI